MENKLKEYKIEPRVIKHNEFENDSSFNNLEKLNACKIVHKNLIKLLYLIEAERESGESAHNWFVTFMLDLRSANSICDCKLTKVLIKMNSLYEKDAYTELEHDQIKRQIMESRGIVEHLIAEFDGLKKTKNSDKK